MNLIRHRPPRRDHARDPRPTSSRSSTASRGISITSSTSSVVLTVEKLEQKAEANVHVSGNDLHAEAVDADMYAAIDALADKLDRMVVKHKEIRSSHRPENGGSAKRAASGDAASATDRRRVRDEIRRASRTRMNQIAELLPAREYRARARCPDEVAAVRGDRRAVRARHRHRARDDRLEPFGAREARVDRARPGHRDSARSPQGTGRGARRVRAPRDADRVRLAGRQAGIAGVRAARARACDRPSSAAALRARADVFRARFPRTARRRARSPPKSMR